jgi:hypothetical protein
MSWVRRSIIKIILCNSLFDCRAFGVSCITFAVYAAARFSHDASPCYLFNIPVQAVIDTVIDKSQVIPTPQLPQLSNQTGRGRMWGPWELPPRRSPYVEQHRLEHRKPFFGRLCTQLHLQLQQPLRQLRLSRYRAGITCRFFDVRFGAVLFVMSEDEPLYPLNPRTFYESWYFPVTLRQKY